MKHNVIRTSGTSLVVFFTTTLVSIWFFDHPFQQPKMEIAHRKVEKSVTARVAVHFSSKLNRIGKIPEEAGRSDGLQFINEDEGWLSKGKQLWQTVDGGKTWRLIYSIAPEVFEEIRDFRFVNSQLGWMISSGLYKSEDAGLTWNHVVTPMDGLKGSLWSFHLEKDGRLGWIAGGLFYPSKLGECTNNATGVSPDNRFTCLHGAVFRTDDGGLSWQQQPTSRRMGRFMSINFIDSDHGWVTGDADVLHTTDGGQTWRDDKFMKGCEDYYQLQDIHASTISFIDRKTGWLIFNSGLIAKSTNGGKTWCDLFDPETYWPEDGHGPAREIGSIHFKDARYGVGLNWEGLIYETKDGGATWKKEGTGISFERMVFLDNASGWAISKDGELFRLRL